MKQVVTVFHQNIVHPQPQLQILDGPSYLFHSRYLKIISLVLEQNKVSLYYPNNTKYIM